MILWLSLSVGGGVAHRLRWRRNMPGLPVLAGLVIGVALRSAIFALLRPLADRWFVVQINSHWPYLCEFARGEPSCFDRPIEACAATSRRRRPRQRGRRAGRGRPQRRRRARAGVIARALELDPDRRPARPADRAADARARSRPGAALHPKAVQLRAVVARLAVEPSISWIDCQSRKDVMNFWDFDPVEGIGVRLGPARCNPLVWKLRFREMLSPEFYQAAALQLLPPALPVHHGERSPRAVTTISC